MNAPVFTTSDTRRMQRHLAKLGTEINCRLGTLGLGPDIAVRLIDFSEDGMQLVVTQQLAVGAEVEISLLPPGISKPIVRVAAVVRCVPECDAFTVAVRFADVLGYMDMFQLT
jgi:hypothetical protein